MARNVTYSVSPRINPREKDEAPKYYAHVQAAGDVSIREMAERIQQTCTVHKSDVFAVLVALEDVITDALRGGEIVRLLDLGTLQVGISSKGALTEEDYEESMIKKARINFRPGSALSSILGNLTFKKVAVKSSKEDKEAEEGGESEEYPLVFSEEKGVSMDAPFVFIDGVSVSYKLMEQEVIANALSPIR